MPFDIADHVARIDANRTIKDDLMARFTDSRPRKRISVTDLVNPRKAFMQRTHPELQPPLDRKEAMLAGKGFHDLFGHAVSSEEYLEQFVEWNGIVGVIDVYRDVPTELKTTSGLREGEEFRESRPAYVEQLAMYCAMVDVPRGRLVLYDRGSKEESPSLSVFDLPSFELDMVRAEMTRRMAALVAALEAGSPGDLQRCPWFGHGCEFESVCDCGHAPQFEPTIARSVPPLQPNPEEAKTLLSLIASAKPIRRVGLNTLVFPRKAYYDSISKREQTDAERLESIDRLGRGKALADLFEYGRGSESARRRLEFGDIQDSVTYFRDVPALLRTTRLWSVVSRENLVRMFPHYLIRLAFECALQGSPNGRLILNYENLSDQSKLMVYDITFRNLDDLKREAENRLLVVREVRGGQRNPNDLPPCPAWMRARCPHQPKCGC